MSWRFCGHNTDSPTRRYTQLQIQVWRTTQACARLKGRRSCRVRARCETLPNIDAPIRTFEYLDTRVAETAGAAPKAATDRSDSRQLPSGYGHAFMSRRRSAVSSGAGSCRCLLYWCFERQLTECGTYKHSPGCSQPGHEARSIHRFSWPVTAPLMLWLLCIVLIPSHASQ